MFKYALLIGLVLPVSALAADYVEGERVARNCPMDQSGNRYCRELPVEKFITDCEPGMDCHHMQSGAHYSVQTPASLYE